MKAVALLESVARADSANETCRYNIANTHQLIGDAFLSAATDAASAAASACASYRQSAHLFDAMRRRGTLAGALVADADHVADALAACDRVPRGASSRD